MFFPGIGRRSISGAEFQSPTGSLELVGLFAQLTVLGTMDSFAHPARGARRTTAPVPCNKSSPLNHLSKYGTMFRFRNIHMKRTNRGVISDRLLCNLAQTFLGCVQGSSFIFSPPSVRRFSRELIEHVLDLRTSKPAFSPFLKRWRKCVHTSIR